MKSLRRSGALRRPSLRASLPWATLLALGASACVSSDAARSAAEVRAAAEAASEEHAALRSLLEVHGSEAWAAYLRPAPGEAAWREIPWRTSFRDGLRDAADEGKPLLLWGMNGHPLGAT